MDIYKLLDSYREWYLKQPTILKIVVLPFLILLFVYAARVHSGNNSVQFFLFFLLLSLSLWYLYNQYLDALSSDNLKEMEEKKNDWKDKCSEMVDLNLVFNELVLDKSKMYLKTINLADKSKDEAKIYIRKKNSLEKNINRIIISIFKLFSKYADTAINQNFRVTFLVPNGSNEYLICKSWCNTDGKEPRSLNGDSPNFYKNGETFAGYIWERDIQELKIIDNIPKYLKDEKGNPFFTYLHKEQENIIKSILGYSIREPIGNTLLGIICVDSNVENAFSKKKNYFTNVLKSFEKRIIFEARFASMKNELMEATGGPNEKTR